MNTPTSPARPGISILIPTHNRAAILARTLDSLRTLRLPPDMPVELVVVANACADNTELVIAETAPRLPFPIRCVIEPVPGLSVARNRAVAAAAHDLLIFLDDDVRVAPDWLLAHHDLFMNHRADVTTGRIDLWWEETKDPGWLSRGMATILGHFDLGPGVLEPPGHEVRGGNFGFRREVFEKAGPFSPALGRAGTQLLGGEESLFSQRAVKAGAKVLYSGAAAIEHWVPAQRVTPEYFARASRGAAYSIERMRDRFPPTAAARSIVMGLTRCAGHALLAPVFALAGNRTRAIRSRVQRAVGAGQFRGAIDRLRFGPLA